MDSEVLAIPREDRYERHHLNGLPKASGVHEQHRLSQEGVFDHFHQAHQRATQREGYSVQRVSEPL